MLNDRNGPSRLILSVRASASAWANDRSPPALAGFSHAPNMPFGKVSFSRFRLFVRPDDRAAGRTPPKETKTSGGPQSEIPAESHHRMFLRFF